jgi:hypothetical protein
MEDILYFVKVKKGKRDTEIILCYKRDNQYFSHYKNKLIEDSHIYHIAYLD